MKSLDITIAERDPQRYCFPLPRELFVLYDSYDGGLDVQLSPEFASYLRQELSYYIGEKNNMMLRHVLQQRLKWMVKQWALAY